MTITLHAGARYFGLTADTKPTLAVINTGAEFIETDEAHFKFIWDGSAWQQRVDPS